MRFEFYLLLAVFQSMATPISPVYNAKLSSTSQQSQSKEPLNPLLATIRTEFRNRNPRLHYVSILDLRPFPALEPRKYLVIGWAIREDRRFSGDFNDELFGFFIVDSSLNRILRVLDVVPTPRWLDYEFSFSQVTSELIVIRGKGQTYGDQPRELRYSWTPYD